MRHRLSPRDTILVAILGSTTVDDEPFSGRSVAEVSCGCCERATYCRNWFVPVASVTLNGTSACDWSAPELDFISSTATTTPCSDVANVPSGNLDLNVNS